MIGSGTLPQAYGCRSKLKDAELHPLKLTMLGGPFCWRSTSRDLSFDPQPHIPSSSLIFSMINSILYSCLSLASLQKRSINPSVFFSRPMPARQDAPRHRRPLFPYKPSHVMLVTSLLPLIGDSVRTIEKIQRHGTNYHSIVISYNLS